MRVTATDRRAPVTSRSRHRALTSVTTSDQPSAIASVVAHASTTPVHTGASAMCMSLCVALTCSQ